MSTSEGPSWIITNGGTPTPGKHDRRPGYTHDDVRQYCAQSKSLCTDEKVYLGSEYVKTHPKPKAQPVTQASKSRLTKLFDPRFDQIDADRAELGLKPSKPVVTPTISSDQVYELADPTVRRKVKLLTLFDGKENEDLEATKGHSPPLVLEGYVPVPILETDGGRFISVLEKHVAFVSK